MIIPPPVHILLRYAHTIKNVFYQKSYTTNKYDGVLWQRSYYDHIIRGEKDYQKIWEYIDTNHLKWESDCFFNDERS